MNFTNKLTAIAILYICSFTSYYCSYKFYDGDYELVSELIANNDLAYNLMAITEFTFVFATFALVGSVRKFHKLFNLITVILRLVLIATTFSTINELIGLNIYFDTIQEPVFWTLMSLTVIYSILKYDHSKQ